jgi:hypothetical protein
MTDPGSSQLPVQRCADSFPSGSKAEFATRPYIGVAFSWRSENKKCSLSLYSLQTPIFSTLGRKKKEHQCSTTVKGVDQHKTVFQEIGCQAAFLLSLWCLPHKK